MLGTTRRPAPFGTPATRLHGGRIVLVLALLIGAAFAGWVWVFHKGTTLGKSVTESATNPGWTAAQLHYDKPEPKQEPLLPAPVDKYGEQIAKILAMLHKMNERFDTIEGRLTALEQRKPPAQQVVKEAPKPPPPPKAPGTMLYVAHEIKEGTLVPTGKEYVLAPGSKIPCLVETKIVSDVQGFFTCKVSVNVWDSPSGHRLLVPQGSTVLGTDHANDLVYGSNRLDTVSLSLSLPDGRTVDLGKSPITDAQGVAGLVSDIDNHYLKLLGAVFIGGVLRGGATAIQTSVATASGAGPVAAGVASLGNQATSRVLQPYINIRPTITVEPGMIAHVLLTKPLLLKEMWR